MIFISAGHHQESPGASYKDVTEYDLTTKWADLIAYYLSDNCLRVPNGYLRDKVNFVNGRCKKEDLAVEIHFNSAKLWKDWNKNGHIDDGEMINVGRGSETLFYPGSEGGKKDALVVQDMIGSLMKPDRGVKEGWYQCNPDKGPDYFLARTKCHSLIIEPEFIDNLEQLNSNMKQCCELIAASTLKITGS